MAQQSDEQIAILARERDPEYFGHLVLRYQDSLLRFVRSIVWDEESARDVTQVTFEKAFVALHAFDAQKSFKPWLYGIARNEAFSHLRRTKHHREIPFSRLATSDDESAPLDVPDTNPPADLELARDETAQKLRRALAVIDARYRAVLTLFYLEDMAYEEIARVLRLPLNTVRTHLRRGKTALRNSFCAQDVTTRADD